MSHENKRVTVEDGIEDHDIEPAQDYQQECDRFVDEIKLENEIYLMKHPEIMQILTALLKKMTHLHPRPQNILKDVALHFTSPDSNFDKGIRTTSKLQVNEADVPGFGKLLEYDFLKSNMDHKKSGKPVKVATIESTNTTTSSFISIRTSESTLMTPAEPTPSLEETSSEMIKSVIFKVVNKAVYSQVTEDDIKYDIAYVELKKAVEDAIEIPVIQIREDLTDLLKKTFYMFELYIEERERNAAQNTWEIRMKKKWKRRLRRQYNYKGYETEQMIKSETSPQSFINSCKCSSQFSYNRYPKDHYGVYLPQDSAFSNLSVTAVVAVDEMMDQDTDMISQRSGATYKSIFSAAFSLFDANRKMKSRAKSKTILTDDDSDGATGLTSAYVMLFKPPTYNKFGSNDNNLP